MGPRRSGALALLNDVDRSLPVCYPPQTQAQAQAQYVVCSCGPTGKELKKVPKSTLRSKAFRALLALSTFPLLAGIERCPTPRHEAPPPPPPPPMGRLTVQAVLPPVAASEAARAQVRVRHLQTGDTQSLPTNLQLTQAVELPPGRAQVEIEVVDPNGTWVYRAIGGGVVHANKTTPVHISTWEKTVELKVGRLCLAAGATVLVLCVVLALLRSDLVFGYITDSEWLVLALSLVAAAILAAAGVLGVAGLQWLGFHGPPHWAVWVLLGAVGSLVAFELQLPFFGIRALDALLVGGLLGGASVIGCLGWIQLRGAEPPWLMLGAVAGVVALLIRFFLHERL